MWNGGESYDYPGDFDSPIGGAQNAGGFTKVANAMVMKVEPKNIVNIHVNIGRELVEKTSTTSSSMEIDISKVLQGIVQEGGNESGGKPEVEGKNGAGAEYSKILNETRTEVIQEIYGEKGNKTVLDMVQEKVKENAESGGTEWKVIVLVVVGIAVVIILLVAVYLRYRLVIGKVRL